MKVLLEERQEISLLPKHIAVVAGITSSMMLVCIVEYFAVKGEIKADIQDYFQHLVPLTKWCQAMDLNKWTDDTFFFGVDIDILLWYFDGLPGDRLPTCLLKGLTVHRSLPVRIETQIVCSVFGSFRSNVCFGWRYLFSCSNDC